MIELVCDICGARQPAKHYDFRQETYDKVDLHPEGWVGLGVEDKRLPPGLRACSPKCVVALRDRYSDFLVIITEEETQKSFLAIIPSTIDIGDLAENRRRDYDGENPLRKDTCWLHLSYRDGLSEWCLKDGQYTREDGYAIDPVDLQKLRKITKEQHAQIKIWEAEWIAKEKKENKRNKQGSVK